MVIENMKTTILSQKFRRDKNHQQYLILELENSKTILVFANQVNPSQWNDLQVNQTYQFTVKKGKNDSNILISYEIVKMGNAQDWLAQNYSDKGYRTRSIYLNQQLEGVLDCQEYKWLRYIFISTSVNRSKLEIKGGSYEDDYVDRKIKETKIIPCISATDYLNQNYPQDGTCQIENDKNGYSDFGKKIEQITTLDISKKGLEGNLDLSGFTNLERLYCYDNCLTNHLNLNNCGNDIKQIWCYNNYLTQIVYPSNPEKITELFIYNNNLNPSDLTIFSPMRNLEWLWIGNNDKNKIRAGIYNRIEGSCEPLKDLNKLEKLNIENTDINSGWEYLPASLRKIEYDTYLRPDCKLASVESQWDQEMWKDIHEDFVPKYKKDWLELGFGKEQTKEFLEKEGKQLGIEPEHGAFLNWFLNFKKLDLNWALENEEEFKDLRDSYWTFETCQECQQPNTSGSYYYKWCQSCNAKHFQVEFNTWTSGNTQIDKFIQKCQKEATNPWNVLEWIPYEQFENIEHIADGGFGKVEKAEWKGGSIEGWDNKKKKWKRNSDYDRQQYKCKDYQTVALKTLTNSQNLNQQGFLQELTLYKMFKSELSNMVPCYGISKDTKGNYIMVMKYMKEGNLREYLRKNYQELKFCSEYGRNGKLNFLLQISQGLKDIHRKNLVHRDFHSGNIIVGKDEYNMDECRITDLGLSKPVDETEQKNKIYGVMPYVAPEILQGKPYTQSSDIYSFGIIAYEILTCLPPFANQIHDLGLSLKITRGERPQFPKQVKYPQLLVDLIKSCWEQEPNNRPTAREISEIIREWFSKDSGYEIYLKKDTELYHQYKEVKEFNETLPYEIKYPTYQSQEVWHSKPIDTKQITQQLEKLRTMEYSLSTQIDFTNLNLEENKEESNNHDWTTIHSNFTDELIKQWQKHNFTFEQCRDWINVGLQPTDYNFCAWLRDNKNYTFEQVLNKGNLEQLNQEFFNWWQEEQTNIEIPPK